MSMSNPNPEQNGGLLTGATDVGGQSEMMLALANMSNILNDLWAINLSLWMLILVGVQARGIYEFGGER